MNEKNKELARMFYEIADALEFKGELAFKINAYRKAARALEDLSENIEDIHKRNELRKIPGVGEGIAKKIKEYLETGKMKKYDEALHGVPKSLLEMMQIQNLGPRTLALAYEKLGVKNLEDLKRAIEDGSLAKLEGMGEKKVENIKKGIELYEMHKERIPIFEAWEIVSHIIEYLKDQGMIKEIEKAGSLRRMKETVGDIDILATGEDGEKIIDYFTKFKKVSRVLAAGVTKGSVEVMWNGVIRQVDLRIVPEDSFGAALQYFTGSKAHNIKLRTMAKEKGLKISEYGVFKKEKKIAGKTEEEVYNTLGLPWIPPELREDRGEIEAALQGKLPKLIEQKDIKGDLHIHSKYSDGIATIEEIVKKAAELGYEYIGISDHSQSAKWAGGMNTEDIKKRHEEIDRLQKKYPRIKIFKGIEVEILQDGSIDYPVDILREFDIVIAAIHIGFRKNVTMRIKKALENPYVHMISHPTGRLISKREGYDVDVGEVLQAAQKYGKWLELNAYPDRLDLSDVYLKKAKEMGIKIAINTDAHHLEGMLDIFYGVGMARRGWLEKKDVINSFPLHELLKLLKHEK